MATGIFAQVFETGGSILSDVITAGGDVLTAREATRRAAISERTALSAASSLAGIQTERFKLVLMGVAGLVFAFLIFRRSRR